MIRSPIHLVIICSLMFMPVCCSDKSVTLKEPEPPRCPDAPVIHTGEATFYTFASGAGACMFDSTPNDLMVGAMNAIDYAGSAICGSCVQVIGPRGTIHIRIVDLCPECPQGHIDLSPMAFSMIGDIALGHVPIRWQLEQCNTGGPLIYHFKDGSNQWWTAVQLRNHRYPILSLEYLMPQGTYKPVNRLSYNYFVEPTGMGTGPFTFRVTDIYGHVLIDSAISHVENGNVQGHAQFPPCSPSAASYRSPFMITSPNFLPTTVFWIVMLCWIVFAGAFLLRRRPPSVTEKKRESAAIYGIALEAAGYALVWTFRRPDSTSIAQLPFPIDMVVALVTVGIALASVWLVLSAVRTLGKQWAVAARLVEDHTLITAGVYGVVRNPIYAGMFGLMIATGLAVSHWWALLLAIGMFWIGTLLRVRSEEKLLREAFGNEFEEYSMRVPALLPFGNQHGTTNRRLSASHQ